MLIKSTFNETWALKHQLVEQKRLIWVFNEQHQILNAEAWSTISALNHQTRVNSWQRLNPHLCSQRETRVFWWPTFSGLTLACDRLCVNPTQTQRIRPLKAIILSTFLRQEELVLLVRHGFSIKLTQSASHDWKKYKGNGQKKTLHCSGKVRENDEAEKQITIYDVPVAINQMES